MPRLLHQLLVTLILMTGIVAHHIIVRRTEPVHKINGCDVESHARCPTTTTYTPISNIFLPDLDFPESFKRFETFYGASLRLKALFDSDGRVKQIAPYPMLPYGVPESAAGKGEFLDYTPFMTHWKFVKELPYGLTEMAIVQIERAGFSPAMSDGQPVGQWVMINIEFGYNENRFASDCSTIDVTIMDDKDVRWTGNTWVHRERGCVLF
ncbi:MAG TPA: hypothetical protein VIX17_00965 [Pyrinomonadaceae bacterium]